MAQIIKFPTAVSYTTLRVRGGSQHAVSVCIVDFARPRRTRWHLQYAMQRAASFRCLKGFTDKVARRHGWHRFKVSRTNLLRRFLLDIEQLVRESRVFVEVDGVAIHARMPKTA